MAYESEWTKIVRTLIEKKVDETTGKPFRIRELTLRGKTFKFNDKQAEFISDLDGSNHKYMLFSGGRGCGKSLALCVKMYLMCKGFRGIRILLGRKNISDIEKTTLQDLFKLIPPGEFEYRIKDGLLNFKNGSQIILMGLDAMQSGNIGDMKKAEQKTKSMNIGAYFIDQLEEIEYGVFQKLNDTMRMTQSDKTQPDYPRQGNMTTNPANFWAYHYFKLNQMMTEGEDWIPKKVSDSCLLEGSMLDNRDNLPEDFVKDRLNREESYVRRFVYGEWNMDILTKGAVFAKEHIRFLETMIRPPLCIEEGCEIFEQPTNTEYRMGVDPSEGVEDPSSISVVSNEGRKVAKWNGMIPIIALADKVKFLYYKYHKPLIIPESNTGAALIRELRDLKVYKRKFMDAKEDRETDKLGFRMTHDSKQQLISHFQNLLREKKPKIYDRKTIEEMKTFIWSDQATSSGAQAQRGFHDDEIISTLLAFFEINPKKIEEQVYIKTMPKRVRKFQYF